MGKEQPLLVQASLSVLTLLLLVCLLNHMAAAYSLVAISPAFFYLPADIHDFTTSKQGLAVFLYTVGAMVSSVT